MAVRALEAAELGDAAVEAVLRWAVEVGPTVPLPGEGRTLARWELLATVGAQSLTVARVLEPHLDAAAILAEAGEHPQDGSTWGVWAAEGPPPRLEAREVDGSWVLRGRKHWCSLAGEVSDALVTAWVGQDERRLFRVRLDAPGVTVEPSHWVPAGLRRVVTTSVLVEDAEAAPVGEAGWYLERDGFWWGGIGVAAVWYGGAVGLARTLLAHTRTRTPDQVALVHLGEVDADLTAARAALALAAEAVDGDRCTGRDALLLGARTRHVVASAVERVAQRVARAVGPGPLSSDPAHVARVADLGLYVRQHHAERDAAGLGSLVLDEGGPSW
ncbi:acyl-CoA dehydrogenase [Nocardioides sp. YIM 123512]|uniref:Acyl-CoA dehydrogenase n=1 Tax=Nocardioides flavescens TaxID=2691959 RepID=A0A6L7F2K7_9ACTN|nr:acyl-CoA dehydrogenase [Nocardioides flavescens]